MSQSQPTQERPVVFGEVLYDRFNGGREILGGAPFNVAWHLQGFGYSPLLISRRGKDDRGDRLDRSLRDWGMDPSGLQVDPRLPSGVVEVTLRDGQATYEIRENQAFDHIDPDEAMRAISGIRPSILYHGTLALRSGASRNALEQLQAASMPTFLDVNFRSPWWSREGAIDRIRRARWVKINDDELDLLTGDRELPEHRARSLVADHGLDLVVVTLGARGALAVDAGGAVIHQIAIPAGTLVDTVGAGDAFTSICLIGLMDGWDLQTVLLRATRFAGRVCGIHGAIPAGSGIYDEERKEWER